MAAMFSLTSLKSGIDRLRTKGGARADALYDLVNGYITIQGTVKARGGSTKVVALPADSRGLCVFKGKVITFHHNSTSGTSGVLQVVILPHPTDSTQTLKEIHFAQPHLGALYVVAEYANGDVFHIWLNNAATWKASTAYTPGAKVAPTVPNGFQYVVKSDPETRPRWLPSVVRTVNDEIIPTTDNGYYYTCVAVSGTGKSGTKEPTWPTTVGGVVVENSSAAAQTGTGPTGDTGTGDTGGTGGTGTGGTGGGVSSGGGAYEPGIGNEYDAP